VTHADDLVAAFLETVSASENNCIRRYVDPSGRSIKIGPDGARLGHATNMRHARG